MQTNITSRESFSGASNNLLVESGCFKERVDNSGYFICVGFCFVGNIQFILRGYSRCRTYGYGWISSKVRRVVFVASKHYCVTTHLILSSFPIPRVNWLIHNFLQRDATTRSLHHQSCDLSSKGSLHVSKKSDVNSTQNNTAMLQTVSESFREEVRRHSSGMTLEPFVHEGSIGVRSGSQASLTVPGNIWSERRCSTDDVEEIYVLQQERSEICLEIPQTECRHSTMQASASNIIYSDRSLPMGEQNSKGNVNELMDSSLSPSLGVVHIMRPLAGIAWTKDGTNERAKSRSSLRSFLSSKVQQNEVAVSKSAPPSPVMGRSTKYWQIFKIFSTSVNLSSASKNSIKALLYPPPSPLPSHPLCNKPSPHHWMADFDTPLLYLISLPSLLGSSSNNEQ